MHYSAIALALATTVMVGSDAFLILPSMNSEVFSEDEFALMNLAGGVDPNNRILRAECLGCLEDGGDGALIYNLVVSNSGSPKLLINGADLYQPDMPPPFLSVPLVPAEATLYELSTQDLESNEVQVMYNAFSRSERLGDGFIDMLSLEATNVDGRDVNPGASEAIEVQMVTEESGKMVILDAKTTSSFMENGDCGVFCGIFAKLRDWGKEAKEEVDNWGKKFGAKFRHCGQTDQEDGDATETGGDAPEPALPGAIPVPPHVHPWEHHHHHHHHHHGHHVMNTLYRVFKHVLVPIAIGIVAGMLVSLVGMIVGHFLVLACQKVAAAWKGKKMEVLSSPEHNAGEEEALLYKEENYRDDVPPPEYDGGDAPEVLVEKQ